MVEGEAFAQNSTGKRWVERSVESIAGWLVEDTFWKQGEKGRKIIRVGRVTLFKRENVKVISKLRRGNVSMIYVNKRMGNVL